MPDGRVAFVPWTAPGDIVRVLPVAEKKRWIRARAVELMEHGAGRTDPVCPHYGTCGGCTLQHLAYEEQLVWKSRFLVEALGRIGGVTLKESPSVHPSPTPLGYRSRATFSLARRGGRVFAGFREAGRPGRVVDVQRCPLLRPGLQDAWSDLRAAMGQAQTARRGSWRVTLKTAKGGCVSVWKPRIPGGPDGPVARLAGMVEVWQDGSTGPELVSGSGASSESWFGKEVEVPGPAFTQVNRAAAVALYQDLLHMVPPAASRIVEAYSGVSLVGRVLAAQEIDVVAIERNKEAAAAARREVPERLRVITGAVEDELGGALPADVVILNPPRSGVDPAVIQILTTNGPGVVLYVSCDPATLARDVGRLRPAYGVASVRGYDLFPQTSHVEALVALERGGADITPGAS